jgi:hypothetical protein
MQKRLKGLERVALVYAAVKHAQALSLEQAAGALGEAESLLARQREQAARQGAEGRSALEAGDALDWRMHESERQFTEWNADALRDLRARREAVLLEAVETYRAGRMQLEQMESVLRELRSKRDLERAHTAQRESDDRFLSRQWWDARGGRAVDSTVEDGAGDNGGRMKSG